MIRSLRDSFRLPAGRVAPLIGISEAQWRRLENGSSRLSRDNAAVLNLIAERCAEVGYDEVWKALVTCKTVVERVRVLDGLVAVKEGA